MGNMHSLLANTDDDIQEDQTKLIYSDVIQ